MKPRPLSTEPERRSVLSPAEAEQYRRTIQNLKENGPERPKADTKPEDDFNPYDLG